MAKLSDRVPENVDGDFFVDASCIDCDRCRQIAPRTFGEMASGSFVKAQPANDVERLRAEMALVACPTSSIGTIEKRSLAEAIARFPDEIARGVYDCGFAAESSFGATSYLIVRPDARGGNVLVDSPRFVKSLVDRIRALGGARALFLTHRDDVADHDRFHDALGCSRVMHAADARALPIETRFDDVFAIDDELTAIPVPGHTRGSAVLLYRPPNAPAFLFTGDHVWASDDGRGLSAGRGVCWYSWEAQTRSMEALLGYDFEYVLPGHGRAFHADSSERMRDAIAALVARMRGC